MIKARKETQEAQLLTNQNIVQTLIRQHDLLIDTMSRNQEDTMRLIRNCTVLLNSSATNTPNTQETLDSIAPQVTTTINRFPTRTVHEALNQGNDEIVPIVWQINKYNTIENLVGLRTSHRHDHVTTVLLRKGGPLYKHKDHWVKIRRIINRVQDFMVENGLENLDAAAKEVDNMERRGLSLNQFAEHLRISDTYGDKYCGNNKRKRK